MLCHIGRILRLPGIAWIAREYFVSTTIVPQAFSS